MVKVEDVSRFWTSGAWRDISSDDDALEMAARSMLAARRALEGCLPIELIHDPVMDVLLALFVADADGRASTRAEIDDATPVAPAVTRRWIAALAQQGLVAATDDRVALTASGRAQVGAAMRAVIRSQIGLNAAG